MALTTPAKSLEELCRKLWAFETNSNLPIARVLNNFFGSNNTEAEFYSILSAIHGRFAEIGSVISDLPALDDEPALREKFQAALKQLNLSFQAECITQDWADARTRFIDEASLERLSHAGTYMKASYSYEVLDDEKRTELLTQIDALIEDLGSGVVAIPEVFKQPISIALSGLKRVVAKFDLYGHSALSREWSAAFGLYACNIQDASNHDCEPSEDWWRRFRSVMLTIYIVVCGAGSFDQGVATIGHRSSQIIAMLSEPHRQRQLPAPAGPENAVLAESPKLTRKADD